MGKVKVDTLSFEETLARLEELVEQIDAGDLPLAEARETFKWATERSMHCEKQLREAEAAIEQIDAGDVLDEKPDADTVSGSLFDVDESEA